VSAGGRVELVVCGAAGRMGRRIIALATDDPATEVVAAIEAPGAPAVGKDAGEAAGVGKSGITIGTDLDSACAPGRVIVDFTNAEASIGHLRTAARRGTAIVVGSTGFSPQQRTEAEKLAGDMPTVIAANMSLGINVLLGLVEDAVRRLGPRFDCEIVEIHHNRKKDAPSGTALALAETAASAAGRDPRASLVLAREGMTGERREGEIGVMALRGGDAVGDHTVMLVGTGERLELTHRAASRDCLASGAVRAAVWLHDKPAGLYSMRDVIAAAAS
jgi:4-hydroxy-tetrahydrodipicolinate reductase